MGQPVLGLHEGAEIKKKENKNKINKYPKDFFMVRDFEISGKGRDLFQIVFKRILIVLYCNKNTDKKI